MMVESRPLQVSPVSPHQNTPSTTVTVPRRSIAELPAIVVYMYANLKYATAACHRGDQDQPTHHMMVESRPTYHIC